jgi:uncharacterized protein (TIGR02270 family)
LSWTEDRLQGALDGVRVAGDQITRTLEPALAGQKSAEISVAAHLLAAKSSSAARAALVEAVRDAVGPRLGSLTRGMELAELDGSFAPVTAVLSTGGPEHCAALCRLKAFRRSAPGRELGEAFASDVPALQIEALRAAFYAVDGSAERYISAGLKNGDPFVRQAAIQVGVRRGAPGAWETAVGLASERQPESAALLPLIAMLGSAQEQQWVIAALRDDTLRRAALWALPYIGTPEAVEICVAGMREPQLARSAAEAYCAITGADLERDRLAAPEPPDTESPPALDADPLDADLVPKAQDLWPLPDLEAVRRHWSERKSRLTAGVRYFQGRAVDLSVLMAAIEQGPMLRRPDLITEMTARTGGRYDVEPRAFAHVQKRMMANGRGAAAAFRAR